MKERLDAIEERLDLLEKVADAVIAKVAEQNALRTQLREASRLIGSIADRLDSRSADA